MRLLWLLLAERQVRFGLQAIKTTLALVACYHPDVKAEDQTYGWWKEAVGGFFELRTRR